MVRKHIVFYHLWFYRVWKVIFLYFLLFNEGTLLSLCLRTLTKAQRRCQRASGPRRGCFFPCFFLLFFTKKSWFVVVFWSAKACTHTDAHTSGITAQTWRQRITNSPLPFCHSVAPLEQMGDECWREERTLFINSFFFFSSPSAHIFPHSQSCYMNQSLTSPQQTNFCRLIIAAALSQCLQWFFGCFMKPHLAKSNEGFGPADGWGSLHPINTGLL